MSLTPFADPVVAPDGTIFDLLNIVPFIKEHGTNPVTGRALAIKELTTLHFHKNPSGEYHCPLTFKVFNDHSHIVAIRTSGNVYVRNGCDGKNLLNNLADVIAPNDSVHHLACVSFAFPFFGTLLVSLILYVFVGFLW